MIHESIFNITERWVGLALIDLRVGDRVRIKERNGDEHTVMVKHAWDTGFESRHHTFRDDRIVELELDTRSRPKLPSECHDRIEDVVDIGGSKYEYGIRGNHGWALFTTNGEIVHPVGDSSIASWKRAR